MGTGTDRGPDSLGNDEGAPDITVGSDLLDFRSGQFHGDVVAKKVEQHFHHIPSVSALQSLPGPVPGFVGRDRELQTLLHALDPAEPARGAVLLSSVTGLGGVGKTALALQAAHAAQRRGYFPAGVVFLDLHGYDNVPVAPEQALEQLLLALGVPQGLMPTSADARAGLYRSVLAEVAEKKGALLVVVDNASHSSQVRPLLPGHPCHRVLLTSRDVLAQLGARLMHLGVLTPEHSVEALKTALASADPTDMRIAQEPDQVRRLCGLCGYLPLALHIAAALLVNDPGKPIEELADELADLTTRIDHLDDGERAMRAAFDMSYHRLGASAARLLGLIALAPGPEAGPEALAALCGAPPDPRSLDVLVRAHLIETGSRRGRWRMHDLVRAYAVFRTRKDAALSADGHAARARLLSCYQQRVADSHAYLQTLPEQPRSGGFADRDEALRWLDTEREGLVAAAQWAIDPEHAEAGVRFALSLCHYLAWRRHFDDAAEVYQHAIKGARLLDDRLFEGMAHDNLGMALRYLRRGDEAVAAHRCALELFHAIGAVGEEGTARYNLGYALLEGRRFDQALEAFEEADVLLRAAGAVRTAAMTQNALGILRFRMEHYNEALVHLDAARVAYHSLGDTIMEAISTNNRARVLRSLGQLDASLDDHTRCVTFFESLSHTERAASARNDLALTLHAMGRFPEAIEQHTEALDVLRQQKEQYREAMVLNDLGSTLRSAGRHQDAAGCHEHALMLLRDVFFDTYGQARSLDLYAAAVLATGDVEKALQAWKDAVQLYRRSDSEDAARATIRRVTALDRRTRGSNPEASDD
ncbi:tetratricopeptide repeat protein [Streptomyces collinus]|uniref:tetratricopeptide repeat protein n=1 Tax=Streptomyces collinus TaxID=42684 RepID=UPI0029432E22|nr:tetratricopeptide repeat protein [Streptomyces collinus]